MTLALFAHVSVAGTSISTGPGAGASGFQPGRWYQAGDVDGSFHFGPAGRLGRSIRSARAARCARRAFAAFWRALGVVAASKSSWRSRSSRWRRRTVLMGQVSRISAAVFLASADLPEVETQVRGIRSRVLADGSTKKPRWREASGAGVGFGMG